MDVANPDHLTVIAHFVPAAEAMADTPASVTARARRARDHGIHGFCYELAVAPEVVPGVNAVLDADGKKRVALPDVDAGLAFCFCLGPAAIDAEDPMAAVLTLMAQPHYLRVDGLPLLLVRQPAQLREPRRTLAGWRRRSREAGLSGLYLVGIGKDDPRPLGFDAACELPHGSPDGRPSAGTQPDAADYAAAIEQSAGTVYPGFTRYPRVETPGNGGSPGGPDANPDTASGAVRGIAEADVASFERGLRAASARCSRCEPAGKRLLFIDAGNRGFDDPGLLHAVRRVVSGQARWQAELALLQDHLAPGTPPAAALAALQREILALERAVAVLAATESARLAIAVGTRLLAGSPAAWAGQPEIVRARGALERFNQLKPREPAVVFVGERIDLAGWIVTDGPAVDAQSPSWIVLDALDGSGRWHAPVWRRQPRDDVSAHLAEVDAGHSRWCGFRAQIDTGGLPAGDYQLQVAAWGDASVELLETYRVVHVRARTLT